MGLTPKNVLDNSTLLIVFVNIFDMNALFEFLCLDISTGVITLVINLKEFLWGMRSKLLLLAILLG